MVARFLVAAAFLLVAGPALAFHCPLDMKTIDEVLSENPPLTEDQLTEVKGLRAEGERLHNAGDHQHAVEALAKALEILGVE